MMGRDNDHWFWIASLATAGAVVLGLIFFGHSAIDVPSGALPAPNVAAAEASPPLKEVTNTPSYGASLVSATAPNDTIATVYECDTAGRRTFSDQRCAPNARVRPIKAPSRMDPQDTGILSDPVTVEYSRPSNSGGEGAIDDASECAAIQAEIDAIDAHMRAGYGSAEGEYLRTRRRNLRDRYYQLRCHHPYR